MEPPFLSFESTERRARMTSTIHSSDTPTKPPRVCCRFVASHVAARNDARLGVGRRQWLFPCQVLQRQLTSFPAHPLRAGPVFTRCGVIRRLFGMTKLFSSCLASRKNRLRRGRGRNGNRP